MEKCIAMGDDWTIHRPIYRLAWGLQFGAELNAAPSASPASVESGASGSSSSSRNPKVILFQLFEKKLQQIVMIWIRPANKATLLSDSCDRRVRKFNTMRNKYIRLWIALLEQGEAGQDELQRTVDIIALRSRMRGYKKRTDLESAWAWTSIVAHYRLLSSALAKSTAAVGSPPTRALLEQAYDLFLESRQMSARGDPLIQPRGTEMLTKETFEALLVGTTAAYAGPVHPPPPPLPLPAAVTTPRAGTPVVLNLTVPANFKRGETLTATTPGGQTHEVAVPDSAGPNQSFQVTVPSRSRSSGKGGAVLLSAAGGAVAPPPPPHTIPGTPRAAPPLVLAPPLVSPLTRALQCCERLWVEKGGKAKLARVRLKLRRGKSSR